MSLAIVYSRANLGMLAPLVTIEVHLSKGLPGLSIVGLPEKAVKESKDRVRSAIINNGFEFPIYRTIINLAPADLPKEGGRFDLPIALGILAASSQLPKHVLDDYEFAGELALTGALNSVKGVLPMALSTKARGKQLMVPMSNVNEAVIVSSLTVYSADHLLAVCAHLTGKIPLQPAAFQGESQKILSYPDLADVRGQHHAKRALEIAAAGGHSVLFTGHPGTGKTMLSSRLPGILPEMTDKEAQETAAIYSVSSQGFNATHWRTRPFRSPHHTASSIALVGGGSPPKPGEISLAHNGILFLDELPEFNRHVLEALREPLEAGVVTISRASHQAQFPAQFQLVAAMNPCPCGYYGDANGRCRCTHEQVIRYQNRLSGPLLDRIDLHVVVQPLPLRVIMNATHHIAESSVEVRQRVMKAREKQEARSRCFNSVLPSTEIKKHCELRKKDHQFLESAVAELGLSARAYNRILRISRTISDLANSTVIEKVHLQEALAYRRQVFNS